MSGSPTPPPAAYRGRFAPSPTGPLHLGSLIAAVGSWLQARRHNGQWLVRMEDIDPPREQPGAASDILRALDAFGLHWDGPVLYQSTRADAYRAALARLRERSAAYPCACSRREIAERVGDSDNPIYPGTCRNGVPPGRTARAWRVRTDGAVITFDDRHQGAQRQLLETQVGDFVVHRADGLVAYQLAVVVDDAEQGITEVVRGADLLDSTPRQIHLQHLLGLNTPAYLHLPVAADPDGRKLSKQTGAPPLALDDPGPALWAALAFLGQNPPAELRRDTPGALLQWARRHWEPARVPRTARMEPTTRPPAQSTA